jgi:tetratricopeptide (TPR) repeat protein
MKLHPQDANLRCEVAWLYGEQNLFVAARESLDEALNRQVAHPAALEWRIVYLTRQGWYRDAEVAAANARATRPEVLTLAEVVCSTPLQRDMWRRALDDADEYAATHAGDPKFAIVRAAMYDEVSTSENGPGDTVIGDDPLVQLQRPEFRRSPETVALLARLLRKRHRVGAARELLDRVRAELPIIAAMPDILAEEAELDLLREETVARAFERLTRLHDRVPWSPRFVRQYAIALASFDRAEAAVEVAQKAVARARANGDPCPVELYCLLGELYIRSGRYREAIEVATAAGANRSRGVIDARLLKIDALAALGDMDAAFGEASALRELRPASRRTRLTYARALEYVGRGAEAVDVLGLLDEPLARDRTAVLVGSWIRRGVGDFERASSTTLAATRVLPDSAGIKAAHAWARCWTSRTWPVRSATSPSWTVASIRRRTTPSAGPARSGASSAARPTGSCGTRRSARICARASNTRARSTIACPRRT